MKLRDKLKSIGSGIAGIVSLSAGAVGGLGLCCSIPVLGTLLAGLGVSSLFLARHSEWFLAAGILFLGLSAVLFMRHYKKHKGRCNLK